jgi:hypothetical protein
VTTDDALALAQAYIDAEWAVVEAVFTEPSDEELDARRAALAALTLPGDGLAVGASVPGRRPGMTAAEVEGDNELLAYYVRRALFAVVRHEHPLWGDLYAAYASGGQPPTAGSYGRLFYLAGTEQGPRVVAEYDADPETDDVTWIHLGGAVVSSPGPVAEARLLGEPRLPRDLAHWRSLG